MRRIIILSVACIALRNGSVLLAPERDCRPHGIRQKMPSFSFVQAEVDRLLIIEIYLRILGRKGICPAVPDNIDILADIYDILFHTIHNPGRMRYPGRPFQQIRQIHLRHCHHNTRQPHIIHNHRVASSAERFYRQTQIIIILHRLPFLPSHCFQRLADSFRCPFRIFFHLGRCIVRIMISSEHCLFPSFSFF